VSDEKSIKGFKGMESKNRRCCCCMLCWSVRISNTYRRWLRRCSSTRDSEGGRRDSRSSSSRHGDGGRRGRGIFRAGSAGKKGLHEARRPGPPGQPCRTSGHYASSRTALRTSSSSPANTPAAVALASLGPPPLPYRPRAFPLPCHFRSAWVAP